MIEEIDFETYLYISKDKFQVCVYDKSKQANLYDQELKVKNKFNFKDLNNLSKFLDENIYKIEKLIGNFIKNIILIIENDENLNVNISVKKKNYERLINKKFLENTLIELKDIFKENYQNESIMHMVTINYIINEKKYSSFDSDFIGDYLCIEVNFISISNYTAIKFEKLLEKYQINISQYLSGNYVKQFLNRDNIKIFEMAHKIKNGHNIKEVVLIPKNIDNKGFFEKFFHMFS